MSCLMLRLLSMFKRPSSKKLVSSVYWLRQYVTAFPKAL